MQAVTLPIVNKSFNINGLTMTLEGDPERKRVAAVISGLPLVGRMSCDLTIQQAGALLEALTVEYRKAFSVEG